MKAYDNENDTAVAVCSNCGKALSKSSCIVTEIKKIVCSEECKDAVVKLDKTIALIFAKTLNQNKTSAYGLFLSATIFLVFGLYQTIFLYFGLGIFCIAMSVGAFIWGGWQLKISKKT